MAKQAELWPNEWDPLEIAYFAGLFDGEGSIALYFTETSPKSTELLHITNTDIRPLVRAQKLFGGRIISHSPATISPRRQATWRWYVSGKNSERFLQAILPHIQIKRAQAEIYLAIRLSQSGTGHARSRERNASIRAAARELSRLKKGE